MPWGFAAAAVGTLGAAAISSNASKNAADTQANAANNAAQTQWNMFNTVNDQQAPYRQAGTAALNQLTAGTQPGGQFTHQFDVNDLNATLAPNYQFMLQQGLEQAQNQYNATGGLVGGNALQGLNTFAQNYAQNAYQQAYNNYNSNQTNIYNRLSNLAGLGQTANQTSANVGMNAANNAANYNTSAAAAQAAGTVGQSNAWSNAIGSLSSIGTAYAMNGSQTGNNLDSYLTSSSLYS